MKSRGATVLGRNNLLETIKEYVEEIGNKRALIITGGAGTRKSSIMARTADATTLMAANNQITGLVNLLHFYFMGTPSVV